MGRGEKCADALTKWGLLHPIWVGWMLSGNSAPNYDFSPLNGKEGYMA